MRKGLIILLVLMIIVVSACSSRKQKDDKAATSSTEESSSPELMLLQTMLDVHNSGIDGLKSHMTEKAASKIDKIASADEDTSSSGGLLQDSKDYAIRFLKEKVSDTEWNINEIKQSDQRTEVILDFNYSDAITGTLPLILVQEDNEWKINGIELPDFEKISLKGLLK